MRIFILLVVMGLMSACGNSFLKDASVYSPDGSIEVRLLLDEKGELKYNVFKDGETVLQDSRLGIVRSDQDLSKGLTVDDIGDIEQVVDNYQVLTAKESHIKYEANKRVLSLTNKNGAQIEIIFQVSDDGVAFRYFFPENFDSIRFIKEEKTSYNFSEDTKAWLQPSSVAKTGWQSSNPSYEENYLMDVPVGTPCPTNAGWVYPALFKTGSNWVVITETDLHSNYCGTSLNEKSHEGEYSIRFPQDEEVIFNGELNPQSSLPWYSPWRVLVIGDLKTVVESNLGTDLASPAKKGDFSWVKPGKAAWSWVLLKDDYTIFSAQKEYIDYAAEMGWEYCLIDGYWDVQIGYEKLAELGKYAKSKNIGLLLWYNSAGDWNTTSITPRNLMLTHESRMAEFYKIKAMGFAGVKIDFFGGDGQSVIQYYHDILTDAAEAKLLVNFHGCTLPRGWERTYPNLMTMEAVKGMEYNVFEQINADLAVEHATMLPFTRNLFDPMDYTPVCFSDVPNIKRHSSNGFELATSVMFTSGIQHYAETDEGMKKVPDFVQYAMRKVPSVWNEVKFLAGYPGKDVILARRNKQDWYVAGINGETKAKSFDLDLSFIQDPSAYILITDGVDNRSFNEEVLELDEKGHLDISIMGNGGFLILPQK